MGMIFVPLGYKNKKLGDLSEVHGGSAWGAGTIAGADGSRQPSALELDLAHSQGFEFGSLVKSVNRS
jgi:NAD(P)H dehydrogenase (quinone)